MKKHCFKKKSEKTKECFIFDTCGFIALIGKLMSILVVNEVFRVGSNLVWFMVFFGNFEPQF